MCLLSMDKNIIAHNRIMDLFMEFLYPIGKRKSVHVKY